MAFELRKYTAPDFTKEPFVSAPEAVLREAPKDAVAPEQYHAMSIYPEYFKIGGQWLLAEESRMDCVPCEEGIYVWPFGFEEPGRCHETFAFRQGRSRETAFSRDYDAIYDLLRYEKEHGYILWVMGPAFSFDYDAREAFSRIIAGGYAQAVLAGNALATHDLEGAYLKTALGQNIYTQENQPNGHYNHLDTINRVKFHGSIPAFIEAEHIDNGIIYNLEKYHVPYVLAGSIRDDGPLPEVYGNVYEAQNAMRNCVRKATTVICMATMLHTIATGNMTPSFRVLPDGTIRQIYFYCVDISEFMVNKLADRGSLSSHAIVTNVQDFIVNVAKGLGV